jgi:hypothetical protein
MIQLPQGDGATVRQAISVAYQLLVDEGDYRHVQALLNEGKTARFRIKCDELTGFGCQEWLCCIDEEFHSIFLDYLYGYLEDKIEPCTYFWAPSFSCIQSKGQIEVVVKPLLFSCR